jgi:hypothetical protein
MTSCGFPIEGAEIGIVDDEGPRLPERRVGEIVVRAHCLFSGHYLRPNLDAKVHRDGGYFTADMVGYLADGQLYVSGRENDLIIVGGKNIYRNDLRPSPTRCRASVGAGGGLGRPRPPAGHRGGGDGLRGERVDRLRLDTAHRVRAVSPDRPADRGRAPRRAPDGQALADQDIGRQARASRQPQVPPGAGRTRISGLPDQNWKYRNGVGCPTKSTPIASRAARPIA